MTQAWTLQKAIAYYGGAAGKNPRWSWSGRTPDGDTVVMTFWRDRFDYTTTPARYIARARSNHDGWLARPGNQERLANLIWAVEHCDSLVRPVIIIAEDTEAEPRTIRECYPQPNIWLRINELDRKTGEFKAVIVDPKS